MLIERRDLDFSNVNCHELNKPIHKFPSNSSAAPKQVSELAEDLENNVVKSMSKHTPGFR